MHSPVDKQSDGIKVTKLLTVVSIVELIVNGEVAATLKAVGRQDTDRATNFLRERAAKRGEGLAQR